MKRLFNTSSEIFFCRTQGTGVLPFIKEEKCQKHITTERLKGDPRHKPPAKKEREKMRRNTAVCPCSIWPSLGIALRYYPQQRTHSALLFASTIDTYKVVYFPMDTNEELPPAEL